MPTHGRALVYMALSALSFAAMAIATKLATATLPAAEVAFVRFALMLAPFLLMPRLVGRARVRQRLDLLIYRGLFGGTAVLLYFIAIEHVPVGTATLLNYSSPIWAVTFAALFLGERARPLLLLPFALALGGLLLVTGALTPSGGLPRLGTYEMVGLASSVLSGGAVAAIRAARRTEGSWSIYGSFTLFGLAVSAPFAFAAFRWPDPLEWALLLTIGATSVAAQLLMTYAYKWVTNLQAGVLAQLTVVASTAAGVVLFGDPLGWQQGLGTLLALAGIVGVVWIQSAPRAIE